MIPIPPRRVLLWLAVFAAPALLQAVGHVLFDFDPGNLLVDPAELSDEVTGWDGAVSTLGIVGWVTAGVATWLAASVRGERDGLWRALVTIGAFSFVLAVDDRFLLHEKSGRIGIPEVAVLALYGVLAVAILWVHRAEASPHGWYLAGAALGFAVSGAIDVVVEGILELYVSGERFLEENAKFFGILCWAAFALGLARRSLRTASSPGDGHDAGAG